MIFSYIDEKVFANLNPDVTGIVPLPVGPVSRGTEINSRMMGLFAGVTNPLVRDAAWEYIRFQNSTEAAAVRVKHLVEGGFGRFLHPDLLRAHGYDSIAATIPAEWRDCLPIALADSRPEPYGRNANVIYDILTTPIRRAEELALAGQLAADPAERRAQLLDLLVDAREKADADMLGIVPPANSASAAPPPPPSCWRWLASVVLALRQMVRIFLPGRKGIQDSGFRIRRFPAMEKILHSILILAPSTPLARAPAAAASRRRHHRRLELHPPLPRRRHGLLRLPHLRRLHLGLPRQLRQPALGPRLVAGAAHLRPLFVPRHLHDLPPAHPPRHPPAGSPARQNPLPPHLLSARLHHRPRRHPPLEDLLRALRSRPDQPPRHADARLGWLLLSLAALLLALHLARRLLNHNLWKPALFVLAAGLLLASAPLGPLREIWRAPPRAESVL
jgi:hypothetical protein